MESSLGKRISGNQLLTAEQAKKCGVRALMNTQWERHDMELNSSSFPVKVSIDEADGTTSSLSVKRWFKVPAHLGQHLPGLMEPATFDGLVSLSVSDYVFLRILRACSKRSGGDNGVFARLVNGVWVNSDFNAKQLREFAEFVFDAGAPLAMLKELARPGDCILEEKKEIEMAHWVAAWVAPVVSAGHIVMAAEFAAHLGFPSASKKLLERSPFEVPRHPRTYRIDMENMMDTLVSWVVYEARKHKNVRWKTVKCYGGPLNRHECPFLAGGCQFKGTVSEVRVHVDEGCAHRQERGVMYCTHQRGRRGAPCGFPLDASGDVRALTTVYRHHAKCENWVAPFFQMGYDRSRFVSSLGSPNGPMGKLTIVPDGNKDRIYAKVYKRESGGKADVELCFEVVKMSIAERQSSEDRAGY